MSELGGDFGRDFQRETWILLSVGVLGAVLRFVARLRRLGIKSLQLDDFLMIPAVVWYIILCVALNVVATSGGSNLMTVDDKLNLPDVNSAERERESKWVFVSEHAFLLCIWTLKVCMLTLYFRITDGLHQQRWVTYITVFVAISFIATELSLFLICRPVTDYWAVLAPDYQCSSYQYYEIIQGCFSILADLSMLLVAIPMVLQVHVPMKQKLTLLVLFGMGIFVIIAAALNKVYCLVPQLISYVYMSWYFREATVAILVTNLPLVWSLVRDFFPGPRSPTGRPDARIGSCRSGRWTCKSLKHKGIRGKPVSGDIDVNNLLYNAPMTPKDGASTERVMAQGASNVWDSSSIDEYPRHLQIWEDIFVEHVTRPANRRLRTALGIKVLRDPEEV